jgi:hypothetical protein
VRKSTRKDSQPLQLVQILAIKHLIVRRSTRKDSQPPSSTVSSTDSNPSPKTFYCQEEYQKGFIASILHGLFN